mgnify:CR=1 FL=1
MAKKPAATPAAPEPAPLPETNYPTIEGLIETASPDELAAVFTPVKEALAGLKGPKADAAKKVSKGIERAEELLSYLLQVREKLEAERAGGGSKGR